MDIVVLNGILQDFYGECQNQQAEIIILKAH
jgi:hypothetical protein